MAAAASAIICWGAWAEAAPVKAADGATVVASAGSLVAEEGATELEDLTELEDSIALEDATALDDALAVVDVDKLLETAAGVEDEMIAAGVDDVVTAAGVEDEDQTPH